MKKLTLTIAACAIVLAANAKGAWTLGSDAFTVDTLFHATTGPGVTTTALRLSGSDADGANTTNIFYSTIDLTNPDLEIRGVQAKDNADLTESVKAMGERKTAQGIGIYLAGVNGDFFNMGSSPTRTNGLSLVDGTLYNTANGGTTWQQWATYATVYDKKDIKIEMGVDASFAVRFPSGQTHKYWINPNERSTNFLCIYTPAFGETTGTNKWGTECQIKLLSGSIDGRDAVFEVLTAPESGVGSMAIPADGYVLSGVSDANTMVQSLKVGDKISLGQCIKLNGKEISPSAIIGGCSLLVSGGEVADAQYFSPSIVSHFDSRQARTAIGYNSDRSKMIILTADKYASDAYTTANAEKKTYGTSNGFDIKKLAQVMHALGCYTAMNFDGGGSSQLYNHKLGIRNVPYGGDSFRPVANGIFAVSTSPVDNTVAAIEVVQKNVSLTTGQTFTPRVYGYNQYGVLVNDNITDFTLTFASALGTASGTTFTASDANASTVAVVTANGLKCGVNIKVNDGSTYYNSGDYDHIMVGRTYVSDQPAGTDKEPFYITERWRFVNDRYNDGWDATAPNWDSADAIKSKACPRFATGRNGRLYTIDMTTMSIAEVAPDGTLTPLYKLPALTETYNGVADYYGAAISSDDAGNFLIGHLFTKPDTYRLWTIYSPKYNKAQHFAVDLGSELSNGRIDNIGRVVGDLTKEAYAFVAPKATGAEASQHALILHFKGKAGDPADVTLEHSFSDVVYLAGAGTNTFSTCQPKYASVDEMKDIDPKNAFYSYSKVKGVVNNGVVLMTHDEQGHEVFVNASSWDNYSALNGFDTFLLGGKRYFVVAYADAGEAADNDSGQHLIFKDASGNTVGEWNNPDYKSLAGYNTITAVPVDANNVNIYLYNCTGKHNGTTVGAIAGALLHISTSKYEAYEPVDITPEGYKFDDYTITDQAKGAEFKLYSTETNNSWSIGSGFYHKDHPTAFDDHGHLTALLYRSSSSDYNNQTYIDTNVQPMFAIRKVNDHVGQALVINQSWSPLANLNTSWPNSTFKVVGSAPQLNFFLRNEDIKADNDTRHYVRVRLVYNVLERGCHYAADLSAGKQLNMVRSIYATHENVWVVPAHDEVLGALYPETGMTFGQFEGETGKVEDLAENPVVRTPDEGEIDALDAAHGGVTDNHSNGRPPYIMNGERFRVYEFDTYVDNPDKFTISVQFNLTDRNANYIFKEIKFTDLGTDEAEAHLLGRRQMGWTYYNEFTSGIEDVAVDTEDFTDTPAVYYNLHGVQVLNPSAGIYIRRCGNHAEKVLIK